MNSRERRKASTPASSPVVTTIRRQEKGRHRLAGFQQRRIFSRLADYTDVNDAEMQRQDPATRQAGGGSAVKQNVASANTIGRVDAQNRGSPAIRPRPVSLDRPYLQALA